MQDDPMTPLAAIKLAYELALTGKFEDVAAGKRVGRLWYGDIIHMLEERGVHAALGEVCASGREREVPKWRQHMAF